MSDSASFESVYIRPPNCVYKALPDLTHTQGPESHSQAIEKYGDEPCM